MSVVTNVAALGVSRALGTANAATARSIERLSSGYRVNRAADDAAGLALSEGLRSQARGTAQAMRNTRDAISLVQVADGALEETTGILQRMRDLTVQAANGGAVSATAAEAIQTEVAQLRQELTRIATTTRFDDRSLLDGSYRGTFQVGADVGDTVTVVIGRTGAGLDAAGLGLAGIDVTGGTSGSGPTTTVTPAVSDAEGVPTSGRLKIDGDFVTEPGHAAAYRSLTGRICYDGRTFDLGSVDYTGAVTSQDFLGRINAAAIPALGTVYIPLSATPGALYFFGDPPGVGSTAADAVRLTPAYTPAATTTGAADAMTLVDAALGRVSSLRGYLGAVQNRLEHTIGRLGTTLENTTAAESRIRDADMALETVALSRAQVLVSAGTAMLAQANQAPRGVLALLG
ncbi:flagellin N-terminal helical domain-containing protein [Blastococcus sp. SYSU D00820]